MSVIGISSFVGISPQFVQLPCIYRMSFYIVSGLNRHNKWIVILFDRARFCPEKGGVIFLRNIGTLNNCSHSSHTHARIHQTL